jgi:hypothetical protein
MDAIRQVLRGSLRHSLGLCAEADRLAAAWVVACGRALAGHGEVTGYNDGEVEIAVDGDSWLEQFRVMGAELRGELERIAGVRVAGIHFYKKKEIGRTR